MTIFTKIINREIPANIVYETHDILAFRDISPQAPSHILIIPKKEIVSIAHATEDDALLLGKLLLAAAEVARILQIDSEGYRIVTNIGSNGGQSVFHLHFHLLGGRRMTWPPG